MLKKFMTGAAVAVALTGVSVSIPHAAQAASFTMSCSNGNFKGTAWVDIDHLGAKITKYKIEKFNGQSGGNKANIDLVVAADERKTWRECDVHLHCFEHEAFTRWTDRSNSNDDNYQDGREHPLSRAVGASFPAHRLNQETEVIFTFDKSGGDPRCSAKQRT